MVVRNQSGYSKTRRRNKGKRKSKGIKKGKTRKTREQASRSPKVGKRMCHPGFGGGHGCENSGQCMDVACVCQSGWAGGDCSVDIHTLLWGLSETPDALSTVADGPGKSPGVT